MTNKAELQNELTRLTQQQAEIALRINATRKRIERVGMITCPACDSERVMTTSEQLFNANNGTYYCEAVKPGDNDSKAVCVDCRWTGRRDELKGPEV